MGYEKARVYSKTFETVPKESHSSQKTGADHVGLHASLILNSAALHKLERTGNIGSIEESHEEDSRSVLLD